MSLFERLSTKVRLLGKKFERGKGSHLAGRKKGEIAIRPRGQGSVWKMQRLNNANSQGTGLDKTKEDGD